MQDVIVFYPFTASASLFFINKLITRKLILVTNESKKLQNLIISFIFSSHKANKPSTSNINLLTPMFTVKFKK